MDERQRYSAVTHFRKPDRPFLQGEGMWPDTLTRWRREGWNGRRIDRTFRLDSVLQVGIWAGPWPPFRRCVYEETEESVVYLDRDGVVRREFKGDRGWSSMPQFVKHPVETEEDFDKLAKRLGPNIGGRFPRDWEERVAEWKKRNKPLMYFMGRWGGFFGPLRNFLGLRRLCRAFFDEPDFVARMMDQRLEVILAILEKVTSSIDLDAFGFWEDMAHRDGPLLAPKMFKEFMLPRYRVVCDFLRERGVDLICVDSDGDVRELIPLWLKAGLNAVWPLEVQAHMDVRALRDQYGRRLVMMGGIDKRALARGPEAIDREVERIWPLVEKGGYIPHTDHSIPPDVSWENYCHYRGLLGLKAGIESEG